MLPYHSYYETLAQLGDPTHPDWHTAAAGLAVLRVIDEWIDGNDAQIKNVARASVNDLIERIPAERPLRPILNHVIGKLFESDTADLENITEPLLTYTNRLCSEGQYELAHDAFIPLLARARSANNSAIVTQISLVLASASRLAGNYEAAEEYYWTASKSASLISDSRNRLLGEAGIGRILFARGDLTRAETCFKDLELQARKLESTDVLHLILHDQMGIASMQYDDHGMIQIGSHALANCTPIDVETGEALLIDFGLGLLEVGRLDEGRRIHLRASILATHYFLRQHAMLALLHLAVLERDRNAFDLYRCALSLTRQPPLSQVQYRAELAKGFSLFGDEVAAARERRAALDIASTFQVHPMFIE